MSWTPEQQLAIDLEGQNILVSAGAGSGKTAVLTARVQRKLLSGIHVNELLVLTFTNAAAQEMKDRIRKTIRETKGLEKELSLLEGAYITTFDAFSLSLVKKYHTYLNIPSNIGIADEVMLEMEKKRILDSIFDRHYLSPKKNFSKLINDFCLKDDEELKKYILNIYKKIELKYDKSAYLKNYFSIMNEEKMNSFIEEYVFLLKEKQRMMKNYIESLSEYFDGDFVNKVEDNFEKLLKATTYDDFLKGIEYSSITVPRGSSEEGKKVKGIIFEIAKEIKEYCIYSSTKEMREEILSTKDALEAILEILQELDKELDSFKNKNYIYNFNDISRLAIEVVMNHPSIKEELTNCFQEILVDEYQDTSDTQEMFISLISRNNVYMVGDIKQSIYRFRNANPLLFKEKYDMYQNTDQGEKIDLLKNFRSRGEVLDNINLLFNLWMDEQFGGAAYKESHQMNFGNTSYIEEGKTDENYQMEILTYDKDSLGKITTSEEEAFLIGKDILEKIQSNYPIFDKNAKVLRKAEYRDFVILLDKGKDFDLYKKIFEYLQIPLTILKDESLKKENDILVIKNLLELLISIKNHTLDSTFRYAFTSVSRSFLFEISDEEIYEYFVHDTFKDSSLYLNCLDLISYMDTMSLSSFFLKVLDAFHYEEKLLTISNIHYFRTRLEYLYKLCNDYEENGKTIYDFVSYLNEIFETDLDLNFAVPIKDSNSCRIMTIHKSKGLEFPVCYFAGFSSKFNMTELTEKILYDRDYGIILPKVDESYKDTILKTLLKRKMHQEEISERIRLLYVAVTRAKEKMIFVIPKQEEEEEITNVVEEYQKEKYNSFLSMMKSIYSVLLPFIKEKEIVGTKDYLKVKHLSSIQETTNSLPVVEMHLEENKIEKSHYSKEKISLITKEEKNLLQFGSEVHKILEEINFHNYDLSRYPINSLVKEKIQSFLQSDFMRDKLSMNMYKEYEFVYEEDNTFSHGMIDLLLEDKDKMIIIDYKLKNIEDNNYDKQLNGYRKYIENKSHKKVECYLYSILEEKIREV